MVRSTRRGKAEEEPKKEEPKKEEPKPKKSAAPKKAMAKKAAAAEKKKEEEGEKFEDAKQTLDETPAPAPAEKPAKKGRKPAAKKDESKEESKKEESKKDDKTESKKKDDKEESKKEEAKEEDTTPEDDANAIWAPTDFDVLSGRGASVNSHGGNKKFRALCFAHKPHFEAGNHAAKRRIATEIVNAVYNDGEARFLKRKSEKGPWLVLTREQAILKACQVMRDYKRPDRLALREMMAQNGQARKRSRQVESTPMLDIEVPTGPLEPIIENPFGVHDHDILCGRGAFVNGHIGNQRLRDLAQERKTAFDAGNYTEKRSLAGEIVGIIKALDPPGRFLKKASKKAAEGEAKVEETKEEEPKKEGDAGWTEPAKVEESEWEELGDEKAIHKACQVMRDIDRPDRKDREERRAKKKQKILEGTKPGKADKKDDKKDENSAEKAAVAEAVAATEEALDKALDAAGTKTKEEVAKAKDESVEV